MVGEGREVMSHVLVRPLVVKRFEHYRDHEILIPLHWTCNAAAPPPALTIDPEKTVVKSAKLYVWVHTSIPWLGPNVTFNYYVNGRSVFWVRWAFWDSCKAYEDTVDVTDILKVGGTFNFKAEVCKDWLQIVEIVTHVTAILTIEYEGEEPEVPPPPPSPWEYVKWGFLLAGIAIVGFLGVKYIKELRR